MSSKEKVRAASERLIEEYSLKPQFAIVVVRATEEDIIHVMTIKGRERQMPELPKHYEGFPITHGRTGPVRFLAAR
ncbi:hypothetical protein [Beijerinckia sp. L45]|uniref:hypothetical protein n=1 Tax=Beijerinckia sp. L45 TaxID=1641855 RepID=UPI00131CB334|nr:hypothetical protein [Beijerinckia sp. L45]